MKVKRIHQTIATLVVIEQVGRLLLILAWFALAIVVVIVVIRGCGSVFSWCWTRTVGLALEIRFAGGIAATLHRSLTLGLDAVALLVGSSCLRLLLFIGFLLLKLKWWAPVFCILTKFPVLLKELSTIHKSVMRKWS